MERAERATRRRPFCRKSASFCVARSAPLSYIVSRPLARPHSVASPRLTSPATGLELGGKDPAYVRPDCNLDYPVDQLVDGSFFNSGQCCCAIERIYVHEAVYDQFVDKFVALTKVR